MYETRRSAPSKDKVLPYVGYGGFTGTAQCPMRTPPAPSRGFGNALRSALVLGGSYSGVALLHAQHGSLPEKHGESVHKTRQSGQNVKANAGHAFTSSLAASGHKKRVTVGAWSPERVGVSAWRSARAHQASGTLLW